MVMEVAIGFTLRMPKETSKLLFVSIYILSISFPDVSYTPFPLAERQWFNIPAASFFFILNWIKNFTSLIDCIKKLYLFSLFYS